MSVARAIDAHNPVAGLELVMSPSKEMTRSVDFADSVSSVTFDVESKCFQATYDSNRDPPSLAVIAVVSTALGKDPQILAALQSVIDTDALDKLATESDNGKADCVRITFCYEGLEITVFGNGVIEAGPEK